MFRRVSRHYQVLQNPQQVENTLFEVDDTVGVDVTHFTDQDNTGQQNTVVTFVYQSFCQGDENLGG